VSAPGAIATEALVLVELGRKPELLPVEVDAPGLGEVRVSMRAAGLCHTDVSAIEDARTVPVVLGHEGAGVVEAVGGGVATHRPGDRVMLCWKTPCLRCRRCQGGRVELCEHPRESLGQVRHKGRPLARMLATGCFCPSVLVPAEAAIPVPEGVPLEVAALVGCAVATGVGAALRTASFDPGACIGVWGAGAVGQNIVAAARMRAAGAIVAVDPVPRRREEARAAGATHVADPASAAAVIAEASEGRGLDTAFEVVGEPAVMRAALDALAPGGELVLVGAARRGAELTFRPRAFMSRQQRIVGCIYGSLRPLADLPALLAWCADGRLDPARLIGDRIPLADLPGRFSAGPGEAGARTLVSFP
jgi:S-(hydroxymethyl)glutathione dehydrogenase/alcohol dehydrogenase